MRTTVLLLILLVKSSISWAQNEKPPRFHLYFLSREIKTDVIELGSLIRKAKSLQEVRQLVLKNVTAKKGKIIVLIDKDETIYRWEKRFGEKGTERLEDWITAGVRGIALSKISDVRGFKNVLKDTIVLIDTFKIMAAFDDLAFPVQSYQLRFNCGGQQAAGIPVQDENILLFVRGPLAACGQYTAVSLYNNANMLSRFTIFLPSEQLLSDWRAMTGRLQAFLPSSSNDDIAGYITSYIHEKYGQCTFEQVKQWLFEKR